MHETTANAHRVESYRDLVVWRRSMELALEAYRIASLLPPDERFRLTDQMLRAAVSVPSNIAEGRCRRTRQEYAHFVNVARGSLEELETLLQFSVRAGLLRAECVRNAEELSAMVGRMLNALRVSLARPATT